ncbi:HinT-interacting membrane complex protein P80 [Mycoplasmopsis gallopavonis]|uniref:Membrane protein P80 n=1 Tax=Mycoplasmopsis gallopavonis TaxID=76629 RepID=A0A449AZP7_9BACT|nr:hypothetical protein [Mycoplasmopsis gallopavonis]RIV16272.1 hypothetical protein D1113_02990 [Mycoplasmopsis gallopavonis]VEU72955.1 Uncharacterised protein [Mycoplasmopsis gallopavonis]
MAIKKTEKSFFERLSEKNYKHDNKHDKKVTNKKKRTGLTIGIGIGLTIAVATAIAVPLGLNIAKVNYLDKSSDDTTILKYKNPNATSKNVILGDLDNQLQANTNTITSKLNQVYKQTIFEWYNEEQAASEQFQFRVNASLNTGDSQKTNIALKTLEQIRKDQKAKLEDQKLNYQKIYKTGWEQKFNELLLSDSYGNSKTEAEAIEHATFQVVEKEATRRFRVKIQKRDNTMLKTATKDYKQISSGGLGVVNSNGEQAVTIKNGEAIFPYLKSIDESNAFTDLTFEGMLYYEIPNTNKIVTFSTESFIPKYMSPLNLVNEYVTNNNLGINTNIIFPGEFKNTANPEFSFSEADKKTLANLFKYQMLVGENEVEVKPVFEIAFNQTNGVFKKQASEFMTLTKSSDSEKEVSQYQTYLNLLTKTKDSLATSGISSFKNDFASEISLNLATLASEIFDLNVYPKSLPIVNLASLFKLPQNIQDQVNVILEQIKGLSDKNAIVIKVNEINNLINDFIVNSSERQFQDFINSRFNYNLVFENATKHKQTSFAYQVENLGGFLVLADSKIQWVRRTKLDDTQINNFIKNQIKEISLNEVADLKLITNLNAINSKNVILASIFKDSKLVEKLQEKTELKDIDFKELEKQNLAIVKGNSNVQIIDSLVAINKWVDAQKKLRDPYNIHIQNGQTLISYRDNEGNLINSNNEAETTISNIYQNALKQVAKGRN